MCIGVPLEVLHIQSDNLTAIVGDKERPRTVSLMMLNEQIKVGDYLLIQVGNFAVEKLTAKDAQKALKLQQALAEGDFDRAAQLY